MKNTSLFYRDISILIKNKHRGIDDIKLFDKEKITLYDKLSDFDSYSFASVNKRYLSNKINFYEIFTINPVKNNFNKLNSIDLKKGLSFFKNSNINHDILQNKTQHQSRATIRYVLTLFGLILTNDVYHKDIKSYISHKQKIENTLLSNLNILFNSSVDYCTPYLIITSNKKFIKIYNNIIIDMVFDYVSKYNELFQSPTISKDKIILHIMKNHNIIKVENIPDLKSNNISKTRFHYVYKNILTSLFRYNESKNIEEIGKFILNETSIMKSGGYLDFALFYNKYITLESPFDFDYYRSVIKELDPEFSSFDHSLMGSYWKSWNLPLPNNNKYYSYIYSLEASQYSVNEYFIKKYSLKIINSMILKAKSMIYQNMNFSKSEIQDFIASFIIIIQNMTYFTLYNVKPEDKTRWAKHLDKNSKKLIRIYFKLICSLLDKGYITDILEIISKFDDHEYLHKSRRYFNMKFLEFFPIITQTLNYIYKYYNKPLDIVYKQANCTHLLNKFMILNYFGHYPHQINSLPPIKDDIKFIRKTGENSYIDQYMNYIILNYYVNKYDNKKGIQKIKNTIIYLLRDISKYHDQIDFLISTLLLIDFDSAINIINNNFNSYSNPLINDYYESNIISTSLIELLSWVGFVNNKIDSLAKISNYINIDCMIYANNAIDNLFYIYYKSQYNWSKTIHNNYQKFSDFHLKVLSKIYEINPSFKIYDSILNMNNDITSVTFDFTHNLNNLKEIEQFFINKIVEAKNKVACKNAFLKLLRKKYGRNSYMVDKLNNYISNEISKWNEANPPKKKRKRVTETERSSESNGY